MKPTCIDLLRQRAAAAGLGSVVFGRCAMIEEFMGVEVGETAAAGGAGGSTGGDAGGGRGAEEDEEEVDDDDDGGVDVALGLHACGNATDHIQEQALRLGAAYVLSPCCIGKLAFSMDGGTSFHSRQVSWGKFEAAGGKQGATQTQTQQQQQQQQQQQRQRQQGPAGKDGGGAEGGAAAEAEGTEPPPELEGVRLKPASGVQLTHPRSLWLAQGARSFCAASPLPPAGDSGNGSGSGSGAQPPAATAASAMTATAAAAAGGAAAAAESSGAEQLVRVMVRLADISEPARQNDAKDASRKAAANIVRYPARERAARLAKVHVELDRSMRAREMGFRTFQLKLLDHQVAPHAKSDIIVGLPAAMDAARFEELLHCAPVEPET